MASRVYYDTNQIPNVPTWVQETDWCKIRILASIHEPLFFEVWIVDPLNVKQSAGTYTEYQRIRVDCERNGGYSSPLIGRIEYIDIRSDEGLGQVLVLQCKDFLLEMQNRIPEHNFAADLEAETGGAVLRTRAQLIERIIQYLCYTQIGYDNLVGGNFTVIVGDSPSGNYINFEDGGLGGAVIGSARIVYDNVAGGNLAIDHIVNISLANEITNNDGIREYTSAGVATGVTALVNGNLYRTIDTSVIETEQSRSVMDGADATIGKYLGNYTNALDLIKDISLGDYHAGSGTFVYDYICYQSNFADPEQVIRYYRRGFYDSGVDISYGVDETNTIKPMLPDYVFPRIPKEGATHIRIDGLLGDSEKTLSSQNRIDTAAIWNTRIYKDNKRFMRGNATDAALSETADVEFNKTRGFDVQRGTVRIAGYPFNTTLGNYAWPGTLTTINNSNIPVIDGTNMMIVSIDYEEPPGIATIELVGTGRGRGENPWAYIGMLQNSQRTADETYLRRSGIERRAGQYSYTDDFGNIYIVNESLIFQNAAEVNVGSIGHRAVGATNPASLIFTGPGADTIGIDAIGVWVPGGSYLWPYVDVPGYYYFNTRRKDNTTNEDHVLAPRDTERGRLGDATKRWLSAHIRDLNVSNSISGILTYGSVATDANGDSGDVAHGLGAVPSAVIVTPVDAVADLFASVHTVGAVNFRISIRELNISTSTQADHLHGGGGLGTSPNAVTHTHDVTGNTSTESAPGDPHTHSADGTLAAAAGGDIHTHTITGSTDNAGSHSHAQQLQAPGVTTVYWVAFK